MTRNIKLVSSFNGLYICGFATDINAGDPFTWGKEVSALLFTEIEALSLLDCAKKRFIRIAAERV